MAKTKPKELDLGWDVDVDLLHGQDFRYNFPTEALARKFVADCVARGYVEQPAVNGLVSHPMVQVKQLTVRKKLPPIPRR